MRDRILDSESLVSFPRSRGPWLLVLSAFPSSSFDDICFYICCAELRNIQRAYQEFESYVELGSWVEGAMEGASVVRQMPPPREHAWKPTASSFSFKQLL